MTAQITAGQFHAAEGIEDWRCLYHVVSAYFRTGSLAKGIGLAAEIGRLVGVAEQQHINVDLRHAGVTVTLKRRDIAVARLISAAARELEIPADPAAVQLINVTLDALVSADVLPFWQALLGYRQIGDDYLFDPANRGPGFGVHQMDAPRPQRNRLHLDIAVPHDQAEARIVAALAAGGHLVSDAHAPKMAHNTVISGLYRENPSTRTPVSTGSCSWEGVVGRARNRKIHSGQLAWPTGSGSNRQWEAHG